MRDVTPCFKQTVEKPWTLTAAKAVVKARSGGRCELGGPTCLVIAHDVDHVFGRRGPDPHGENERARAHAANRTEREDR